MLSVVYVVVNRAQEASRERTALAQHAVGPDVEMHDRGRQEAFPARSGEAQD